MNGENFISAFKRVRLRFRLRGSISGAGDDTEDALQDAFCRLWSRRDEISGAGHAEGLITTTVRNICIDDARRRQAHPQSDIEEVRETGTPPDDDREYADELYRKIDRIAAERLSQRDREILYHREKDGWEYDELAEMYGLSESNVRMIISRARKDRKSTRLNSSHMA